MRHRRFTPAQPVGEAGRRLPATRAAAPTWRLCWLPRALFRLHGPCDAAGGAPGARTHASRFNARFNAGTPLCVPRRRLHGARDSGRNALRCAVGASHAQSPAARCSSVGRGGPCSALHR